MDIFKTYFKIIKDFDLKNFEYFMRDFDPCEEVPMVYYLKDIKKIKMCFQEQTVDVITAFSYFYLIHLLNYKKTYHPNLNEWRCFVTYDVSEDDFEDEDIEEDDEFVEEEELIKFVPRILVSRKPDLFNFIKWNKNDITKFPVILETLKNNGIINNFNYYANEDKTSLYMQPLI